MMTQSYGSLSGEDDLAYPAAAAGLLEQLPWGPTFLQLRSSRFRSKSSVAIAVLCAYLFDGSFGVLFPTLGLFCRALGGAENSRAAAFALFWLGRLISSPVLGHASQRLGHRQVLILSSLLAGIGALIYASATSISTLLVGMLVLGLSAGGSVVVYAYIAERARSCDRTVHLAYVAAAQYVGSIVALPAVGAALSAWGRTHAGELVVGLHGSKGSSSGSGSGGVLRIDEFSVPALALASSAVLCSLLLVTGTLFRDVRGMYLTDTDDDEAVAAGAGAGAGAGERARRSPAGYQGGYQAIPASRRAEQSPSGNKSLPASASSSASSSAAAAAASASGYLEMTSLVSRHGEVEAGSGDEFGGEPTAVTGTRCSLSPSSVWAATAGACVLNLVVTASACVYMWGGVRGQGQGEGGGGGGWGGDSSTGIDAETVEVAARRHVRLATAFQIVVCVAVGAALLLGMRLWTRVLYDVDLLIGGVCCMLAATAIAAVAGLSPRGSPATAAAAAAATFLPPAEPSQYYSHIVSPVLMFGVGYPMGHAALCGLFAKVQGEGESTNIGTRMGWFGASACAARLLALLLVRGGHGPQHLLGASASAAAASVLLCACLVLAVCAGACVYFRRALRVLN